jgi:imidazolonepropionase-like amidohydrolase
MPLTFRNVRSPLRRVAASAAFAAALVAPSSASAQNLDLVNATLIDGTGMPPRAGVHVRIRDGKIYAIDTTLPAADPAVRRVDLSGRYLLPGFIDAHAHLDSPDAARRALASGVTTVRVLGDAHLRALGTRELIRAGHVPGPELLVASSIVRPRPGVAFYQTYPQFGATIDGELRGPETIAAIVQAMIDRGVDVIKVGASERAGLASTDPRRPELTEDEIRAAVETARAAGRFVAAHAHAREGAAAAVRAGVRSIEHGTYVDDDTLAEMRKRRTFFVPTLAVMSDLGDPRGNSADDITLQVRTYHMMAPLREAVRKAKALGIVVAASTDGSYGDGDDTARIRIAHEIEMLVRHCGFTPLEAIEAATSSGARVLGIDSRTGAVQPGLEADLLVFERDPIEDTTVLFDPLVVISNGVVVIGSL